jgi:hypothetical protein
MTASVVEEKRPMIVVTKQIIGNLEQIVRGELRLLQAQLVEEVRTLAGSSLYLIVGAGLAQLSAGCLLLGVIYLLGTAMPLWAAAIVIGVVCAVGSVVMLMAGQQRLTRLASERARAFDALLKGGT